MSVAAARRPELRGPVVVVDDHELLCQTLVATFERAGLAALAVAPTGDEAVLAEIDAIRPAVVLLDFELGPQFGTALRLVEPIRALGARVVVMTGVTDKIRLAECVEAGADGLLSKTEPLDRLLAGIEAVATHGTMLPVAEREALLAELRADRAATIARREPFERLTVREAEVLRDLMDGANAERIAEMAFVSVSTVRSHIKSILMKLGVSSQLAAVALAQRAGWHGSERPTRSAPVATRTPNSGEARALRSPDAGRNNSGAPPQNVKGSAT
jgi:DNA-binding NarL/FixJ family response regulator